jgi:hypothetical protein
MRKNQHVVPHDSEWAVREEGRNRVNSVHKTQKEAIEIASGIARDCGGDLIVHGRDGRIRDRDSYGSDPYPPKDRAVRKVLFPVTDSSTAKEKIREAVREVVQESRAVN